MPLTSTTAISRVLPIVLQGDLMGEAITGGCTEPAMSTIAGLRSVGERPGDLEPVVVSTGDLVGPDPQWRHPIESGSGLEALARVLQHAGLDAALPGDFELALDPSGVFELTTLALLPWTLSNGRPEFPVEVERIIDRGPLRIGIDAVIDPSVAALAHAERPLELQDAERMLRTSVESLRSRGADVVIGLLHVPREGGTQAALRMARGLRKSAGSEARRSPDLLVSSSLDQDVTVVALDGHVAPIVSPPRGAGRAMVVRLHVGAKGLELIGSELHRVPLTNDPDAVALESSLCADLGAPITRALDGAVTHEQLTSFVLEIMRRTAGAEIAVLSAQAISPRGLPWRTQPLELDLARAVRFDHQLVATDVAGSDLGSLLALADDPRAGVLGLSDGKVAGRPVSPPTCTSRTTSRTDEHPASPSTRASA